MRYIQIFDIFTFSLLMQMSHMVFSMHIFHRSLQSIALKSWIRPAPGLHWKWRSSLIFPPILVRFAASDR
jgi:hypothetical protein